MLRPWFCAVELRLGCHDGSWELLSPGRPFVIAGRTGSGKTTLVQGLVGTVFGPGRRPGDPASPVHARKPWDGEEAWGRVVLAHGLERYEIRRDFLTGEVTVRSPTDDVVHFSGEGDPAGGGRDARRYRQILGELLGLRDLDAFARTVYVAQGGLTTTELDEQLLAVAAGGHARVEVARREIAEAHRGVTARALHAAGQPAINPRELERVDEQIEALRKRLDDARAAGARRGPLALEREQVAEQLRKLTGEIEELENAHAVMARGSAIEITAGRLRDLAGKLEDAREGVAAARHRLMAAVARSREVAEAGLYPADFPERLARAEVRWQELGELERGRWRAWLAAIAATLGVVSAALGLLAEPLWLVAAAGLAAALAGAVWGALALDARRRRRDAREELRAGLAGVPGAGELGPETREQAIGRFIAQREAAASERAARQGLADALWVGRRALAAARSVGLVDATSGRPGGGPAERLMERLAGAARRAGEGLARERVEMDRIGEASLRLPDGVVPTADGVLEALRARRRERARVEEQVQRLSQELLERGAPAESLDALEAELAGLEPRREALERRARVLEAAYSLVTDAHDAFQAGDQDRLLREVSTHLARITGGELGPVVASELLQEARVRLAGRFEPLESPPLSYGERHALLLAIRMGAATFLGGVGISPPLIVEDPFAHLDAAAAAAAWSVLERIAADRQVIITTQDALLLEHLDVRPDIELGRVRPAARATA